MYLSFISKKGLNYNIFIVFFLIIFIIILIEENPQKKQNNFENQTIKNNKSIAISVVNIDYRDEFFQIKEVQQQIISKHLTYINSISGGKAKIGNSLKMLNNLINICENIRCKNIISPDGLKKIIKRPILNKETNITIFPNYYKYKIKIDIYLRRKTLFWFKYKKKPNEMRLNYIREELLNNIPKYNYSKTDLLIHIRSGDIFVNKKNRAYSQPPLCFYQKIIKENKFKNIYIISNGNENPVIKGLLKFKPKIKFIKNPLEVAISMIVYAYNFIMSVSTFSMYLIKFNTNLNHLYIYHIINYDLRNINCTIHVMEPSKHYIKLMKYKWKKSIKQLNLLLNDNCTNSNIALLK